MSFSIWHFGANLIIFKIQTNNNFLIYLFPDLDIGPLILIDLPDCLIDGSSPQYAVNSLMLLNLFISPNSAIIKDVVNSPKYFKETRKAFDKI